MKGLMQEFPLTLQHILWRGERLFPEKQIVSRLDEGIHRYTFADMADRARRIAGWLLAEGLNRGERVATFAWNHHRHQELYYAAPCSGAVLHTLNIRLHPDQLSYIVRHASDRWLFFDGCLEDRLASVNLSPVRTLVRMGPGTGSLDALDYEELVREATPVRDWPQLDEHEAAGLCYTSGTTGDPKGVLYSHRSTVLHALSINTTSGHALQERDVVLTVVPMFHAMGWGHPYAAVMAGSAQVHPGPFLEPDRLCKIIEEERVTLAAGVPTVWVGVLDAARKSVYDLSSLQRIIVGGAAAGAGLIEACERELGVKMEQSWGMTEISPVGSQAVLKRAMTELSAGDQAAKKALSGLPVPGVEVRIIGESGEELDWDGSSRGELQVRGPFTASAYFGDDASGSFSDGWLRTGDVATIDADGYINIVDRNKDLVKSGGEWISSVELERAIMSHSAVLEAAVIAAAHAKWGERPVACIALRQRDSVAADEIIEHLRPRVASWWLPDRIVFLDEVPKTSVGKFDKKRLRELYYGILDSEARLPNA